MLDGIPWYTPCPESGHAFSRSSLFPRGHGRTRVTRMPFRDHVNLAGTLRGPQTQIVNLTRYK